MLKKIKVLVVEDEAIVALDIKNTLINLNFEVTDIVTNYEDALNSARKNKPDILLTDIYLGNSKNGIEIMKDIQKIALTPTIYLTALTDDTLINEAIKTNPISYMIKPFKRNDLKSAILLAMYKRTRAQKETIQNECKKLGFGFYFNEKYKTLYYDNVIIKLNTREQKLLSILIEAKGQIVPLETLEYLIWPEGSVSSSTLRTLIYRLRAKLEYKLIEIVPFAGCKLVYHH